MDESYDNRTGRGVGAGLYSGADVGTTFPLRAAAADGRPYPLPSVSLTRGARRLAFFRDPRALARLRRLGRGLGNCLDRVQATSDLALIELAH